MMEKGLVSVIVPIYNVEPYLERCLKYIVAQTYKKLEIILVNDGSPDQSERICQDFQEKDRRIKYIYKKNGGLSDARNVGLEHCSGEYVVFIDADDYADEKYIEGMLDAAVTTNSDIVLSDGLIEKNGKVVQYDNKFLNGSIRILDSENAIKALLEHKGLYGSPWTAWGKLFKTSLFREKRFPVGMFSEDLAVMPQIISDAERIAYIPTKYYHYILLREGSIIHQASERLLRDNYKYAGEMKTFVEDRYPQLIQIVRAEYVWMCMQLFLANPHRDDVILPKIICNIRKNAKEFMKSDRRIKYKVLLFMITILPKHTKRMYKMKRSG